MHHQCITGLDQYKYSREQLEIEAVPCADALGVNLGKPIAPPADWLTTVFVVAAVRSLDC